MSLRYDDPSGFQEPLHGGGSGDGGGIAGALLNVGAGLYDSYKSRQQSEENNRRTLDAQKMEAELAYQRSVEMWHMQNMYNSPEAQMARFKEAGLNPHLIYGQGSPGQASSPPQYQPANLQYHVEAPTYGAAMQSLLPTLMSVGTWLQNMRLSEQRINQTETGTEKTRQLINYLQEANPGLLRMLDNRLALYPYQESLQKNLAEKAWRTVGDMEQDYRLKYGAQLFDGSGFFESSKLNDEVGGLSAINLGIQKQKFLQSQSETKLKEAKASWSEFDITDPQAIMMLVLNGVMGLAGQTLRLSTAKGLRRKTTTEVEERMKTGRSRIRRRITQ